MSHFKQRLHLFSLSPFRYYIFSCIFAMFGNGLTYVVMTWVLLKYNQSVSAMAILMTCFWLPNIVLGPLFGVVVDRLSRKNLMVFANAIRAILLFGFAFLLGKSQSAMVIYLLALSVGSVLSLYIPAAMSFVREIIDEKQLLNANATVDIAYELGAVAGMGCAGLILAMTSIEICFLINAACYVIATYFMLRIKYSAQTKPSTRQSFFLDLASGWRYLQQRMKLMLLYCTQMLFFVSFMTAPVLLAPFAKTVLHTTVGQFGWIEAAMSVGIVVGGIFSPYFVEKCGLVKVMIAEAMLAIIAFILFSHTRIIGYSILWYFFIGFSFSAWSLLITYAQENTELEFQGRVQSLFNSISGIFILIFYVLLGNVSHSVGLQSLYWCESLLMLLCIVLLLIMHQLSKSNEKGIQVS